MTVAMVTYNSRAYVADAIASVLGQHFEDFELLICDDASTDGTWELITSCSDRRVRALRNPINIGEYPNRNQALARARGKYLIFIDGDDHLYPHGLGIMAEALDRFPDAAFASAQPPSDKFIYPLPLTSYEFYACQFLGPDITAMNFTQLLFRVAPLRAAGGFDPAYRSGDTHIQFVLGLTHACVLIANGLAWWRRRPGQASESLLRDGWGSAELAQYGRALLQDARCPLHPTQKRLAHANICRPLLKNVVRAMLRGRFIHAWRLLRYSGVSPIRLRHLFSRDRRPHWADVDASRALSRGALRVSSGKAGAGQ
ncbi:MAG: glycosyltransferase family 2 protein [Usitatibacter sp.]